MNEPLLEKESGCVKIDTSTSQYPDRESNPLKQRKVKDK